VQVFVRSAAVDFVGGEGGVEGGEFRQQAFREGGLEEVLDDYVFEGFAGEDEFPV
jgi:hypothetical protein